MNNKIENMIMITSAKLMTANFPIEIEQYKRQLNILHYLKGRMQGTKITEIKGE